jgi:hypothetical protein
MRSAAAFAAVTAVFAGTLVGGLSYTGALDPEMLRGPKEDHPGEARAGWKTHSLPAAGFSIQLPPAWHGVEPAGKVLFQEFDGKKAVASLTVVQSGRQKSSATPKGMAVKRFDVEGHVLTFSTSTRRAAAYTRVFEQAAKSFHLLKSK